MFSLVVVVVVCVSVCVYVCVCVCFCVFVIHVLLRAGRRCGVGRCVSVSVRSQHGRFAGMHVFLFLVTETRICGVVLLSVCWVLRRLL